MSWPEKEPAMKDSSLTRRDFLMTTGIAASALTGLNTPVIGQSRASSTSRIIGANDRIGYGFIGLGQIGTRHLTVIRDLTPTDNVRIVGISEIFSKRLNWGKNKVSLQDDQLYTDYRRMLENKDIDVVVIATPDHLHSTMAIEAMEAGKHIYVEKPMTHTLEENFRVYDTARRTQRKVQVGAHGCSDPKWLKARDVIKANRLGRLLWAQGSYCRNNPLGEWNYKIEPEASPQTIDWNAWLGRAPRRPFSAERFFRWRKYWEYGNGIIGDLWPHRLHPLLLAMNLNEFPKSVSCVGGILCDTDKGNGEPREVADTSMLVVEFPSGAMIFLAGSTVNERGIEDVVRGQKANLLLSGGKVLLQPERPYTEEIEGVDETPPDSGETHLKHQKNFIDALRNNSTPSCDIELAVRVQTVISMAEEAYRKGKQVRFDVAKRRMI